MRGLRFLAWIVGAMLFACLHAAGADPAPGRHRVAFVNLGSEGPNRAYLEAFREGLRELGYVEGRNLDLDIRWANNEAARLPAIVADLLASKPAVVVSTGGPPTVRAIKAATSTVPVVFITGDPVAEGVVGSLARPGGNMSGFAVLGSNLDPKRLEVLRQLAPRARRLAMIWNPDAPYSEAAARDARESAAGMGFTVDEWRARDRGELDQAFVRIAAARPDAVLVLADPRLGFERERIVEFARANRLPGVYFWKEFAELGGLASFGTSLPAMYRRSATYVDKILKGAKPGDLPVEQPTTFELVVNRTAARELGIEIPRSLLQRADLVIE